jgi:NAD(P)-dependent dehydrogenase (short-subunit alcohol dehydrogenase family)
MTMTQRPVAILTAAGSGIGAAAARRLAADGYHVAILSPSGKGEALARELDGLGVGGSSLDTDDLWQLVDQAMRRWGRIDAVVNSAGHGPKGPLLEISDEDWRLGMDYYLMNVVRIARLVTPIMQRQKAEAADGRAAPGPGVTGPNGGAIVNVSTYALFEPEADFPTSGVFRAGLAAFTKLYADRYAADGIRMNNVLPGFIDSLPEKEVRRARIPMGRYGTADEVAELILYLATPRSSYVTGQNIRIDGGITRSI